MNWTLLEVMNMMSTTSSSGVCLDLLHTAPYPSLCIARTKTAVLQKTVGKGNIANAI
jgi:hypothetical protein